MFTKQDIFDRLKFVEDPELGINIVDLGLVYEVIVESEKSVLIKITLTTPACPLLGQLMSDIQERVKEISGIESVVVDIVWEPPWSPEMMSDAAKAMLGVI